MSNSRTRASKRNTASSNAPAQGRRTRAQVRAAEGLDKGSPQQTCFYDDEEAAEMALDADADCPSTPPAHKSPAITPPPLTIKLKFLDRNGQGDAYRYQTETTNEAGEVEHSILEHTPPAERSHRAHGSPTLSTNVDEDNAPGDNESSPESEAEDTEAPPSVQKTGKKGSASNAPASSAKASRKRKRDEPERDLETTTSDSRSAKKQRSSKKAKTVIELSDGEGDSEKCHGKPQPNIVLYVPEAAGGGMQRTAVSFSTSFNAAQGQIFDIIGCQDIPRVPELRYKLRNVPKASTLNLRSANDWDGLREEVELASTKSKGKPVSVEISVFPENYLDSLRNHLKQGKSKLAAPPVKNVQRGRGKQKPVLLDLNDVGFGLDDDSEGEGDGEMMDKERVQYDRLDRALKGCRLCGPDIPCKVDKAGNHAHFNHAEMHAWTTSLVLGKHGVTLHTPPRTQMFARFFNSVNQPPAKEPDPPAAPAAAPPQPYGPSAPGWPAPYPAYPGLPPWWLAPPPPPPAQLTTAVQPPTAQPQERTTSLDSADSISPPQLADFFDAIAAKQPFRTTLPVAVQTLITHDFYTIDSIATLTTTQLTSAPLNISIGNATFILEQAKKEMRRLKKGKGCTTTK